MDRVLLNFFPSGSVELTEICFKISFKLKSSPLRRGHWEIVVLNGPVRQYLIEFSLCSICGILRCCFSEGFCYRVLYLVPSNRNRVKALPRKTSWAKWEWPCQVRWHFKLVEPGPTVPPRQIEYNLTWSCFKTMSFRDFQILNFAFENRS